MSISLATLGVVCDSRAIGMATLGVICPSTGIPGELPIPSGRGSGPTTGIQGMGYNQQRRDDLRETLRNRILQEDDDIVAFIVSMVTKDLL